MTAYATTMLDGLLYCLINKSITTSH